MIRSISASGVATPFSSMSSTTWRVQLDFQSGADNFSTAGFTCNVTERLQFNPALYVSNAAPHNVYGYVVFTYTLTLW